MLFVIEAEATDGFDVFAGKGSKEKAYILIGFSKEYDTTVRGKNARRFAQSHRVYRKHPP